MAGGGNISDREVDPRDIDLQIWPGFVDILSSTMVVLAFALLILVMLISISKITQSSSKSKEQGGGAAATKSEASPLLSRLSSEFEKLSVISPPTLARKKDVIEKTTTDTAQDQVKMIPEKATITDKEQEVQEPGDSQKQVLGEIPKFTDTRVIEVLKELIIVQQDVIAQQRKVIEQQDNQIRKTTREYQSLLSLVTKSKPVEDLKQKITPREEEARFQDIDSQGKQISGTSQSPKGLSTYVLSPPKVAAKGVEISNVSGKTTIAFKDNAQYFPQTELNDVTNSLKSNLSSYKSSGVVLEAKSSDFAISAAEGKRIAVERLLLIRSILIELGVDKSLIKIKTLDINNNNADNEQDQEENYGWVHVSPNN